MGQREKINAVQIATNAEMSLIGTWKLRVDLLLVFFGKKYWYNIILYLIFLEIKLVLLVIIYGVP